MSFSLRASFVPISVTQPVVCLCSNWDQLSGQCIGRGVHIFCTSLEIYEETVTASTQEHTRNEHTSLLAVLIFTLLTTGGDCLTWESLVRSLSIIVMLFALLTTGTVSSLAVTVFVTLSVFASLCTFLLHVLTTCSNFSFWDYVVSRGSLDL